MDLTVATMELREPIFRTRSLLQDLLLEYIRTSEIRLAGVAGTEGVLWSNTAFQKLPLKGRLGSLRDILLCTAAITSDLRTLGTNFQSDPNFHHLVRISGIHHHRLLSLAFNETGVDSDLTDAEGILFTCLCLAALIFHDVVIYPLVETSDIKPRLASRLRISLTRYSLLPPNSISQISPTWCVRGAMIWATMLGCIASMFSSDRGWFVTNLQQLAEDLGLRMFPDVKDLMETYMWFENIDEPALGAWTEGGEIRIWKALMDLQGPS
jgi:hypothetical protein